MIRTADVVGIGASPLMLLRATGLALAGAKVALIDRAARPGGAWAACRMLGFDNVEAAVHLIENRPGLYRVLGEDLGLALQDDPCAVRACGQMFPSAAARAIFHAAVGASSLRRRAPERALRSFRSAWRSVRHLSTPFTYPAGGAGEMVRRLAELFDAAGGEIRLGEAVTSAQVDRDGVRCETEAGGWTAGRLLISSRAWPALTLDGAAQAVKPDISTAWMVVVHFRARATTGRSYVEIIGDGALRRVRNVGLFAAPAPPEGSRLWCVQLRQAPPAERAGAWVADQLVRLALVEGPVEVLGHEMAAVETATLHDEQLLRLKRAAGGRLEILRSTDFADGFVTEGAALSAPSGRGRCEARIGR